MATGRDLAEQLLRRAADDEAAARAMLPLEPVTDAIVGFHAQQAVEKSLKAVLAARNVDSRLSTTSTVSQIFAAKREQACRRSWTG